LEPLQGVLVFLGAGRISGEGVINAKECIPLVTNWLGNLDRRFAVVRADHYVFGTANTVDKLIALLNAFSDGLLSAGTIKTAR
jgi:hypothetical protein